MSENHFVYPWFEKCHLTHLRYVSVTLRNPPRSLPLQKHLLTPKLEKKRESKHSKLKHFSRERPEVRSGCSLWFGAFGGRESTCFSAQSSISKSISMSMIFLFLVSYMLDFTKGLCFCVYSFHSFLSFESILFVPFTSHDYY